MEQLGIEPLYPESSGDDMGVLPEAADLDTEAALTESKEDSDEGDHEPESDENYAEDAESFEDEGSDADIDSEADTSSDEETGSSEAYPEKPDHTDSGSETVTGNSTYYLYDSGGEISTHTASGDDDYLSSYLSDYYNDELCFVVLPSRSAFEYYWSRSYYYVSKSGMSWYGAEYIIYRDKPYLINNYGYDIDTDSKNWSEASDGCYVETVNLSAYESFLAPYESDSTDSLLLVETMERQNDILYAGFAGELFILGAILGVLIIHGFRLRRV